jgi:RNA polymerase sigma factor (sigma-70 family)
MADAHHAVASRHLRLLFEVGTAVGLTDGQLLELFVKRRDEAAFTALVERHGPMVQRVCIEVLRDYHDGQDAFQATFLVLARQAGSIRRRDSLASWLYGVALRVSACTRSASTRRRIHERNWAAQREKNASSEERTQQDLGPRLHAELGNLPERLRAAVVLCYLEGRTYEEAARLLHCPVGTIKSRLATARERLRHRLRRFEINSWTRSERSDGTIEPATPAVPAQLIETTIAGAVGHPVGTAAAKLAANAMRAMFMSKLKMATILLLAAGSLIGMALPFAWAHVGDGHAGMLASAARTEEPRPGGTPAEAKQASATAPEVGTVFFRVVDRSTKQPLAGVTLKVFIDGKVVRELTTDESGRLVIPLPREKFNRLWVTARKDGLAPMKVYLWQSAPELEVPRSYALPMAHGTSVGGVVRDEEGHPIEGVVVKPFEKESRNRVREVLDFDDVSARTDQEGRWHIDLIPENVDFRDLDFSFSHADYLTPIDSSRYQATATREQLLDRSGVTVLYRGVSVTGRVLNREGRPIAGASVRLGRNEFHPTGKTDSYGGFRFKNAAAGESLLTIQASGYAPEVKLLQIRGGLAPLEYLLGKGRTIKGQVFDSQGRPLAGASIVTSLWDPRQSLDGRYQTDATGRFVCDNAPSAAVELTAFKEGYAAAYQKLEPSENTPVFKLAPASRLRIKGTVTDAATKEPIETFTVVPMVNGGDTLILDYAKAHHGGRYSFADATNGQPYRIRIEAKGYLPATSPEYQHDGGEQIFDARLKKGPWVDGIVRGPNGLPLAGAQVIFATGRGISIFGGKGYQLNYHAHMTTDVDGRFSFSPAEGNSRIVAIHDQGYAETFVQRWNAAHDLAIKPWGRIEGTLRVAGKPMAHETIVADLDEERSESLWPKIGGNNRTQTDEMGRFVIDWLPPGEARVYWQPEVKGARRQPDRFYRPAFVDVRPGEATRLDLVQEGGPALVGRIALPKETDQKGPLSGARKVAYLSSKLPEVPYPTELTDEERQEWLHLWWFTKGGSAYRRVKRGFGHRVDLQPDGSFRVDEIQPGAYELHVHIPGHAEVIRSVVIPEPTAKEAVGSVNIGTLTFDAPDPVSGRK